MCGGVCLKVSSRGLASYPWVSDLILMKLPELLDVPVDWSAIAMREGETPGGPIWVTFPHLPDQLFGQI